MGIGTKKFLRPLPWARNNTAELDDSQRSSGKTFAGDICKAAEGPPRRLRGTSPRPAEKQARRAGCPAADGQKTFAGVLWHMPTPTRRGRSAENTFAGLLRGRPSTSARFPPGRPVRISREFSAAGREDLSSGLGSRRGRSAENLSLTSPRQLKKTLANRFIFAYPGRPSRDFSADAHLRQSIPPLHIGRAHPHVGIGKDPTATIGKKQHRRAARRSGNLRHLDAYGGARRHKRPRRMMQGRGRSAEKVLFRGRPRTLAMSRRGRPGEFAGVLGGRQRCPFPPISAAPRAGREAVSPMCPPRTAVKTFAGVLGGRQRCPIVRLGVPPRKVRREDFRGTSPRPAEKQARRARCPAADGPGKTFAGLFSAAGRDALSSGLGFRRGRSAENTFAGILRGRPRETLVVLEVKPRTSYGGRRPCTFARAYLPYI